jgi:hypothetical protein
MSKNLEKMSKNLEKPGLDQISLTRWVTRDLAKPD